MSESSLAWQPADFSADVTRRNDGSLLIEPRSPLAPYRMRVSDALEHWAALTPDQTLVARRGPDGQWLRLTYAGAVRRVRHIAGGLCSLGLGEQRPLAILSGNGIEHLLLGLAAMHVGVPWCPVSPPYSAAASDLGKLRYVMQLLTPGLVAAFGAGSFARAISATLPDDAVVLGDQLELPGRSVLDLGDLERDDPAARQATAAAQARTGPDSIAKFLLTSGSTGQPKAVITTQRMLCSNQVMLLQALPFAAAEPPVLVDWLPWHHTFGGNHNLGFALFNGGTLYIDDGRPTPGGFAETVRNLRSTSPTVYFNVPKGYDLLAQHLQRDAELRAGFYARLRACLFGGAGISQQTWDGLDAAAHAARGTRVPILSGLGATETSPSVTFTTPDTDRAGVIGLPAAGNHLKLAPVNGKLELRTRGPHVTPGYWRQPELTGQAFDEEGYYRLGDAVRLLDPADATRGLVFDGRISEDFKLGSGTWVSVGPLRAALLSALAPLAQDVVIAGLNEDFIAVLIFPDVQACTRFPDDARLREEVRQRLATHANRNPASSLSVRRAIVLADPPSLDQGEITDKGSINQRAVLQRRAAAVRDLYAGDPPPHVIRIG